MIETKILKIIVIYDNLYDWRYEYTRTKIEG